MKNFESIESAKNLKFKTWQSLKTAKGIKKHQRTIIAGKSLVSECFQLFYQKDIEVLFTENMGVPVNLGPQARAYQLSASLFKELDPLGSDSALLVVPIPQISPWPDPPTTKPELKILLPLGDPKNLGAAIRNCAAFGINNIILLKEAAHPFHFSSIKASSGAVFKVQLFQGPSIHELDIDKNILFSLDAQGENLVDFKWPQNTEIYLLVGEEGPGVPQAIKDRSKVLSIPIAESIESLNAHQALGIALYDKISKS